MNLDFVLSGLLGMVFLSVAGVTVALYSVLTNERRVVLRRLAPYDTPDAVDANGDLSIPLVALRKQQFSSVAGVDRLLANRPFAERIAFDLSRAGIPLRVAEYLCIRWLIALSAVFAVLNVTGSWILALPAGVAGFYVPKLWVSRRQSQRVNRFNEQLVDGLAMIVNSLRSGYGFQQGLQTVTKEMEDPIAGEFAQLLQEQSMGTPPDEALMNLTERVRSDDLDLLVTSIMIQRSVGGNLAEILSNIAYTIRERLRIQREVRSLTAQERISGYVIGALPIILLVLLSFANREYVNVLVGTPTGHLMLVGAAALEVMGFFMINRIVAIDV